VVDCLDTTTKKLSTWTSSKGKKTPKRHSEPKMLQCTLELSKLFNMDHTTKHEVKATNVEGCKVCASEEGAGQGKQKAKWNDKGRDTVHLMVHTQQKKHHQNNADLDNNENKDKRKGKGGGGSTNMGVGTRDSPCRWTRPTLGTSRNNLEAVLLVHVQNTGSAVTMAMVQSRAVIMFIEMTMEKGVARMHMNFFKISSLYCSSQVESSHVAHLMLLQISSTI
jgi:hypothetical protein